MMEIHVQCMTISNSSPCINDIHPQHFRSLIKPDMQKERQFPTLGIEINILFQFLLKGLRSIKLKNVFIVLKETAHRQKIQRYHSFSRVSTSIHMLIFVKPVDELNRTAFVNMDRGARRRFIDDK